MVYCLCMFTLFYTVYYVVNLNAKTGAFDSYRSAVVHSAPASYNTSQCSSPARAHLNATTDGCDIVDLLVLKSSASSAGEAGLVLRVVSSLSSPVNVSLRLTAEDATTTMCDELDPFLGSSGSISGGGWRCEVLACGVNASGEYE